MKGLIRKGIGVFAFAAIVLILLSNIGAATNYGIVIGEYGGVPAVSNGANTGTGDGYYQCAEYVKRFYREAMSMDISLAGTNANDYYDTAFQRGLVANPNGGVFPPQPDDVLAFNGTQYGHVAIITEVGEDYVTVIEQNVDKNIAIHNILYDKTANRIGDVNGDRTGYGLHIQGWLRRPGVHIVDQTAYCGSQLCSSGNELIPGNEIKLVYKINNPYSYVVDYTILAAQIRVANQEDKKILYKNWDDEWIDISGNSIENNKIINLIPGTHEYTRKFVIPNTVKAIAGNYDIRLIVLDSRKDTKIGLKASNGNWNGSRVIKNTLKLKKVSQMPNPIITVVSPNTDEVWAPGSQHAIMWTSTGNPEGSAKIELLKNGGVVEILSENIIPVNGLSSYLWSIPATQIKGDDFQIRITSSVNPEYTDTSDGYFTIGSRLKVLSPNGGEGWNSGSQHEIQWSYAGDPGNYIDIELLKNNEVVSGFGATIMIGADSVMLTMPEILGNDYKIKVTGVKDGVHTEYTDTSDGYFSIQGFCSVSLSTSLAASALALDSCNPVGPVHNVNKNTDYTSIQGAINDANIGDEIHIYSGTYSEYLNINKKLILRGVDNGGGKPVIEALTIGNIVTLLADNITFNGFEVIRLTSSFDSGIYTTSNNNTIINNNISSSYYGIYLQGTGVSDKNNTLSGNNISNNNYGIFLSGSFGNNLTRNNISNNKVYGIFLRTSGNNKIYHNNFIDNAVQAYFEYEYLSVWDSGYPSGGNYWKGYTGIDAMSGVNQDLPGSDGIGDAPYSIKGLDDLATVGYRQDRYPLMNPHN